jgi:aminoglycoside phosphotransferase (APT) family kinase protein
MGLIPVWVQDGWEVMREVMDPDVFQWMQQLIFEPRPLFRVLDRYPWTLLHGDYREANLAFPGCAVALDWQEATRGLMTIDLAWFTKSRTVENGMGQLQAIRYYRQLLERYLNKLFDDQEWQIMVDLGNLVDALRSTCFKAYWYKHTESAEQREIERLSIQSHSLHVRNGIQWLENDF